MLTVVLALSLTLAACDGKSGVTADGTSAEGVAKALGVETVFKHVLGSEDEAPIAEEVKAINPEGFAEAEKTAMPEGMTQALKFAAPEGDFFYEMNWEGTGIIITKYTGNNRELIFPAEIEGCPVVQIGTGELGAVICSNSALLVSVVIPEGVKIISEQAFEKMVNLRTVAFPASLEEIRPYAFRQTGLSEVVFPEGSKLTVLEWASFGLCKSLVRVKLPDTLATIWDQAFIGSNKLAEINLPAMLETIGALAFSNCSELYNLTIPDTIITLKWGKYTNECNAFEGTGKLPFATRKKLEYLGYTGSF